MSVQLSSGKREGRLELARQVGLAVDRLDRIVAGGRHLSVAGGRAGSRSSRRRARFPSRLDDRGAQWEAQRSASAFRSSRIGSKRGAGQQSTLRSTSPQAARVDSRASLIWRIVALQVVLQDAVELELLAGRDPQSCRCRCVWARWSQARYWSARQPAADDPDPHHELVGRLLALFLQLPAEVAIVLLVGPVELEDGGGILAEVRRAVMRPRRPRRS